MSEIREQPCHTDQILTDAALRGVRHISWHRKQLEVREAIEQLNSINRRFDLTAGGKNKGSLELLQEIDHKMTQQAIEWITEVGFIPSKNYAITILIEEVK